MNVANTEKVEPAYADIRATCARYGWGKTLCYDLIRQKKIRAVKVGRKTLVEFASVAEYFATLPAFGERRS